MLFDVDRNHVSFRGLPKDVASVDVLFDDNWLWSIDVRGRSESFQEPWPASVVPFLSGSTLVTLKDSATKDPLFQKEVAFTDDPGRTLVADDNGVALSVNKWGRLGRSLEAIGGSIEPIILAQAKEITDVLTELGFKPFIVGGTLLGAIRDKKLLPHDDDADIAYLSEYTNPADVAIEGYRLGRLLKAKGYELMRHSATHMQLHFVHEETGTPYYIDVFAAFFSDDGFMNQPFHVRGKMALDEMLPFGEVEIGGYTFQTPRDTDRWLTINYDADWRTPIPGFDLGTPESTIRRFQNWFGTFNRQRHFWNGFYRNESSKTEWQAGANWIVARQESFKKPYLIDLGAGDGALSKRLLNQERTVVATDYAQIPLKKLQDLNLKDLKTTHLNLYRMNVIALPSTLGAQEGFDAVANHFLDQCMPDARKGAYQIFKLAIKSGGQAMATFFTKPDAKVNDLDPTLWHLDKHKIALEAFNQGLGVTFFEVPTDDSYTTSRLPVAAVFNDTPNLDKIPKEMLSMKEKIATFLMSFKPYKHQREIEKLKHDISELKQEIDELRSLNSKIAQLSDILEEKLEQF